MKYFRSSFKFLPRFLKLGAGMNKAFSFLFVFMVFAMLSGFSAWATESPYDLIWTKQIGVTGDDKGYSVVTNNAGEIFISGYTDDRINGFPNDFKRDLFLIKYDPNGTRLWQEELGTNKEDVAYSVAVRKDGAGNFYVAGRTKGNIEDPGVKFGGFDLFLIKYDATNAILWKKQLGTSQDDIASSVAVDGAGNAYVVGKTNGSFTAYGYTNAGGNDLFIVKYDVNGNVVWLRQIGTAADEEASSVVLDSVGNVYITGHTYGDLGGPNAGLADLFLIKYDANGNLLWTRQMGTASDDKGYGIAADASDNIYVSGLTKGDLGGACAGLSDIFLSKYDSSGNLLWVRQKGTSGDESGNSVQLDANGNAFIAGSTTGSFSGYANAGLLDIFISKYDSAGNELWTKQMGTAADDEAYDAALDSAGEVYMTGYTRGILDGTSVTGADVFLMKLEQPPLPDLTMTSVSGPTIGYTGQWITVSDTVAASGAAAPGFTVVFLLSADPVITASDLLIGSRPVSGLASGASSTADTSVLIPANLAPGVYYIGAIADNYIFTCFECDPWGNDVAESDENNNARAGNQITVLAGSDLSVTEVSGLTSALTGQTITVRNTIKEAGSGASVARIGIYLSTDENITTSDIRLTTRTTSLAAGQSSTADTAVTIPVNMLGGTYWIGAIADPTSLITEYNESNNALKGNQITITGPDLVMTAVSTQSSSPVMGTITVSNTVCTTGGGSGYFNVGIYLSTDTAITTSDKYIGSRSLSGLAAGQCSSENTTVTIPGDVAPGTYYIGVIADYDNQVRAESNETNNALTGNLIEITPSQIDLVMTALSAPPTGVIGGTITVSSTVTNAGTQASPGFYVYFSLNDVLVGSRFVASLAPGASDAADITLTIPTIASCDDYGYCDPFLPGTYSVIAAADTYNLIGESNEANNSLASQINIQ